MTPKKIKHACYDSAGNFHKENGPAVVFDNGTVEYWTHGVRQNKPKEKIPEMPSLELHSVTATFSQEGNTNGTTAEYEELEVTLESAAVIDEDGHYVVLKSNTGWSFDSIDELKYLIERVERTVPK